MKNQFKVGDKVKVREDLVEDKEYGNLTCLSGMVAEKGNVLTISAVDEDENDYRVKECGYWWSGEMLVKYHENKVIFNDKATVLIKDGKKYVSKCKDGDAYDKEKGLLLCLAQANGISYRDLQEMIAGAKDCNAEKADDKAQVREVKRKAKVGEYIKITKAYAPHDLYGNGDIFKVYKSRNIGVYCDMPKKTKGSIANDNGNIVIWHGEYVVLENYTPYKITLSEFWDRKETKAIHCKTEDEAKKLLKAFDRIGKKWRDGDSYTEINMWRTYEEKTIYANDNGFASIGGLWVGDKKPTIYEFNEVDLEH